jgi:hypothetical protein
LPYVPERTLFNRRAGSVFRQQQSGREPFQLSTAAIYQQLQQPLAQQTLPIHHRPQPEGLALYQRWAEQQP